MYNRGGRIQKRGGAQSRLGHCYILVNDNNNKTNQTTVLLGYETRLHHFIDSLCYPYSDFFFFRFFYLLLIWWSEYRLIDCNSPVWFDKLKVTMWQIRLQTVWFGNLARGTSLGVHFTCNEVLFICIRVNIWVWMTVGMKMNENKIPRNTRDFLPSFRSMKEIGQESAQSMSCVPSLWNVQTKFSPSHF